MTLKLHQLRPALGKLHEATPAHGVPIRSRSFASSATVAARKRGSCRMGSKSRSAPVRSR